MAFKQIQRNKVVPESPERLILDLPRRKIPGLMTYQQDMLRAYAGQALEVGDVALQLPTGSGKTLVGLLIGEWRRRRNSEKVVYVVPTKQLVGQVIEQAEEKCCATSKDVSRCRQSPSSGYCVTCLWINHPSFKGDLPLASSRNAYLKPV